MLGSSSNDSARALTIGLDGAIYIAGYTYGNLDGQVSNGQIDAFITKYDASGNKIWTKLSGTNGEEIANTLATGTDGGIYVGGFTQGNLDSQTKSGIWDAFVTKYDVNGNKIWTKLLGASSGYNQTFSLSTGPNGSVYATGFIQGSVLGQTYGGNGDVFLTKFSASGTNEWTVLLGSSDTEYGFGVTTGSDGSVYVTGFTEGNLDGQTSNGSADAFIAKYSSEGTKIWTKLLGTAAADYGYDITAGSNSTLYVTGKTAGSLDGNTLAGGSDIFLTAFQSGNLFPTGSVTISGTVTQGQTLTASNNLTDADGIPTTGDGAIKYQWKAGGVNIASATSSTYVLTQAEVGKAITVTASYTDLQGTAESVTSGATVLVGSAWRPVLALDFEGPDGSSSFGANITKLGSPVIDTAAKTQGQSSLYLAGDGSALIAGQSLNIGQSDFSIEFDFKTDGAQNPWSVMVSSKYEGSWGEIGNGASSAPGIHFANGGFLTGQNFNDGQWHRLAAMQIGSQSYLYVDGILQDQEPNLTVATHNFTDTVIGKLGGMWIGNSDNSFRGWIDNFSINIVNAGNSAASGAVYMLAKLAVPESSRPLQAGDITNSGTQKFNSANNHIYEYVDAASSFTWISAKAAAESKTLAGVSGHLVTITSASEQSFVLNNNTGGWGRWMGASDAQTEGQWKWVSGPEQGASLSGYTNWDSDEPNGTTGINSVDEDYGHFWPTTGLWNDAPNTGVVPGTNGRGELRGYVVEYSGKIITAAAASAQLATAQAHFTEDQTLFADASGLSDVDGLGPIGYRWQRGTDSNGNGSIESSEWTDISGAGTTSYTLGDADVGRAVRFAASYTDLRGTTETVYASGSPLIANINDVPAGAVTLSGTATQGQTLTASNNLTDADGIPSTGQGAIKYQWKAGGVAIAAATSSTYTLTQAEVGKAITVTASYTDLQGSAESVTSAASAAVANVNDAPTGSITIAGAATQGQTLTASNNLTDADGIPSTGDGAIKYQWKAGGVNIASATSSTYVLTQAEVGKAITVTASYTDLQGTAESVTSGATVLVGSAWRPVLALDFEGPDGSSSFGANITKLGSPVIDTAAKTQGQSSLYLAGDGSALIAGQSLNIGQSDFSIEFDFKTDGAQNPWSVMVSSKYEGSWGEIGNGASSAPGIHFANGGFLTGQNFNDGQWHRLAAMQIGSQSYLYVDGILQDQEPNLTVATHNFTDTVIGKLGGMWIGNSDNSFRGWIDNFSINIVNAGNSAASGAVYMLAKLAVPESSRPLQAGDITNSGTQKFNSANNHIYEYVDAASSFTWISAKAAAESKTLAGVSGHLVTITSASEQSFVLNNNTGGWGRWMGASDAQTEGQWKWVSGPEQGASLSGYTNWDSDEPNGTTGINSVDEDYGHFWPTTGLWNDAPNTGVVPGTNGRGELRGYVVEYSGKIITAAAASAQLATAQAHFTEDQTLFADASGLSDVDGLGPIGYRWQRGTDSNGNGSIESSEWTDISGAGTTSYTLGDADVGRAVRFAASYTDLRGTTETVYASGSPLIANINDVPAGAVTLSGTATQGQTLTASNNLTDADGIPSTGQGAIKYQWKAGGVAIAAATSSTYTLTQAEVGKAITVTASYTDLQGSAESVTSAASAAVANVNDAPTGSITIAGAATQGQTLTASNNLTDADGIPSTGDGAIKYQWKAGGVNIASATSSTYVLTQAEVGKAITVTASYTDLQGSAESVTSASSAAVANVNDMPAGSVIMTGTAIQSQDLVILDFEGSNGSTVFGPGITALNGATISTAQKVSGNSSAYFNGSGAALQFNIPALNIGAGDFAIDFYFKTDGAQNPWSVMMSSVREGGWGEISNGTARGGAVLFANYGDVSGAYVNDGAWHRLIAGQSGAESYLILDGVLQGKVTSTATSHNFSDLIVGKLGGMWMGNSDNSFRGWIDNLKVSLPSRSPTQGQTLTASNTLIDVDGIPTTGDGALKYQWKAGGANITGATSSTYTLTQAEVGKAITVTASYTDSLGTPESVTSAASAAVVNVNDTPTGSVALTGTATQGQTLTASNTLSDADGIPTTGDGAIKYQWKAGGANITGAKSSTYTLTQAEVGKAITVTASYTDSLGTPESVTSAASAAVVNVNDTPTGSVALTGTATQGQTLTASNDLNDDDGIPNAGAGAVKYQWQAGGVMIDGATSSSYTLTQAEVGKAITVTASYTDLQGTVESVTSTATASVGNANDPLLGGVSITGTATQGQTLTASNTLSDADGIPSAGSSGAITYQWRAGGAAIASATSSTYTLTQAEVGKAITVTASYTDLQGTAESVTSTATLAVDGLPAGIEWSSANDLRTSESGTTAAFSARLSRAPLHPVTVELSISDATEGVFLASGNAKLTLSFTAANWNTAQSITVKGYDDELRDGDVSYVISARTTSNDAAYDGLRNGQGLLFNGPTLINADDDAPVNWLGTEGNDTYASSSGDDDLYGYNGRDDLSGGKGHDRIYGGYGDDRLNGQEGNDSIEGEQGNDAIDGGAGNDRLLGGTGNDTLLGGDGDDVLDGDKDADTMDGGNGADLYYVDNPGDAVSDSGTDAAIDILYVASYLSAPVVLGAGIENATLDAAAGSGALVGNASNNSLKGNAADNQLNGGLGNDTLESGAGNDTVDAGDGDDLIVGGDGAGNDHYIGGSGQDTVRYTSAFNTILVNLLQGVASGQDIGSDTLSAIENLIGGKAGDTLLGDAQANVIDGHTGNDSITGGGGNDTLDGGEGQDTAVYALAASNYTVTATATGYQVLAKSGAEGTDQLRQVESLQFADRTDTVGSFLASGGHSGNQAKFWKNASLTPSETNKAAAVNLTDAISVLKMIVGLPVNSNNAPLSPHQSIAADFDQDGQVGLNDAIGVLKMVVGLAAPSPTWRYYDADKLKTSLSASETLTPGNWSATARIQDPSASAVSLVGVLTGDVDGSWVG